MILVIAEQRDGKLNRASWETIAAELAMPVQMVAALLRMMPAGPMPAAAFGPTVNVCEPLTVAPPTPSTRPWASRWT